MCNCNYSNDMLYCDMPTVKYCDSYDSNYCEKCDMWMHQACNCGEKCGFSNRPEKPSMVYRYE